MRRKLQLEFLEQRQLLAVGPRLVAIEPNVGDPIERGDVLHQAPSELKLVFDASDVIDGATVGTGSSCFAVTGMAFSVTAMTSRSRQRLQALEPHRTRCFYVSPNRCPMTPIEFRSSVPVQVRCAMSTAMDSATPPTTGSTTVDRSAVEFELQLGAQVISVVPQPITRDPNTGVLSQAKNEIHVYFNEADLDPVTASTPAFYRLIDARDQSLLFPSSVAYDAVEAKAILTFPGDLSTSTYQLQIGASEEANDSISTATDLGTVWQQPSSAAASFVGFIGDNLDPSVARANDIDFFRVELLTSGDLAIDVTPATGLDVAVRFFDNQGNELGSVDSAGIEGVEQLVQSGLATGSYYIGLSSSSNLSYGVDGLGAGGGTTIGSYEIGLLFSQPVLLVDDNSSFDTATEIGSLGLGGTTIQSSIQNQSLVFRMPGSIDEPGHRDIPVE